MRVLHIPSVTSNPNSGKGREGRLPGRGALHFVRRRPPRCCTFQSRNVVGKLSSSMGFLPYPLSPRPPDRLEAENPCPENCPLYSACHVANETLSRPLPPSLPPHCPPARARSLLLSFPPLISLLLFVLYLSHPTVSSFLPSCTAGNCVPLHRWAHLSRLGPPA